MKKMILGAVMGVSAVAVFSFKTTETGNAITERRNGLDVYMYSRPSKDYETVYSDKFKIAFDCNEILTKPLKMAEGKGGEGVIIYPETTRFEVIKYK